MFNLCRYLWVEWSSGIQRIIPTIVFLAKDFVFSIDFDFDSELVRKPNNHYPPNINPHGHKGPPQNHISEAYVKIRENKKQREEWRCVTTATPPPPYPTNIGALPRRCRPFSITERGLLKSQEQYKTHRRSASALFPSAHENTVFVVGS